MDVLFSFYMGFLGLEEDFEMTREQFEQLIIGKIQESMQITEKVIRDAKLAVEQIDEVKPFTIFILIAYCTHFKGFACWREFKHSVDIRASDQSSWNSRRQIKWFDQQR